MCTVSWFKSNNGYELFFNRDEQTNRAEAIAPKVFEKEMGLAVYPVDVQAGGTWIAVNQHGITACLLNLYSHSDLEPIHSKSTEAGVLDYVSRGEIILEIVDCQNIKQVESKLADLEWFKFRTFRLLILDAQANTVLFSWNGRKFSMEKDVNSPKSSSSVDTQIVINARKDHYQDLQLSSSRTRSDFLGFHTSHMNDLSQSVCMHDAHRKTVSLSHVVVTKTDVSMNYYSGSPCESVSKVNLVSQCISKLQPTIKSSVT